jgi:hypothetical protein
MGYLFYLLRNIASHNKDQTLLLLHRNRTLLQAHAKLLSLDPGGSLPDPSGAALFGRSLARPDFPSRVSWHFSDVGRTAIELNISNVREFVGRVARKSVCFHGFFYLIPTKILQEGRLINQVIYLLVAFRFPVQI